MAALTHHLSVDERTTASRFHFAADRERYILTRGLLRAILQRYTGSAPELLTFTYSAHGKPALAAPAKLTDGCPIYFNLSHAHEVAIYAISRDHELGIDIERIRTDIEYEQIARRVFSPFERATLFALPPHERAKAFFRCWTMKEAYIKGHGDGLSMPLDNFDTAFAPGTSPAILATRPDATQAERWTIVRLNPGPQYTAALAVDGHIAKLSCWHIEP
ncbi:MAG TPA: 4'-phosphopantetheinyl transferase superfamily protein [Ktedonobacterales bacterium]